SGLFINLVIPVEILLRYISVTNSYTLFMRTKLSRSMKKNYFIVAALILLLLSIIAFSDNLFTDIGQESNKDPKFIIHGLFFLAWFIILVTQSHLIRKGDYKAHRKWGMWGMWIAIGVVLSTFYVFYAVY